MTRTIRAADFKQKCLALMDEVASGGGAITITKRGKPVAKLTAVDARPQALGCLAGSLEVLDDDFTLPEWSVSSKKGRP